MVAQREIDKVQKHATSTKADADTCTKKNKTLHKTIDATLQYSNYQIYEQCI